MQVELLNNQLTLANERCNVIHQKCVKQGDKYSVSNVLNFFPLNVSTEFGQCKFILLFEEELKNRCDDLEKKLSDALSKNTVAELQGKAPTVDEVRDQGILLHQFREFA